MLKIQNKLANGFVLNITFHKDVLKNGKRVRHLNARIGEHIEISPLTKKRVKHKRSAVSDLLKVSPSFESFSVPTKENRILALELKQILLIMRDKKPALNRYIRSSPLYLFGRV